MTSSESPGESAENRERQPARSSPLPGVLAVVARALAGTALDADDVALLALLGRTVVPSLGDVVVMSTADRSGATRLVGAAPDGAEPAYRLAEHVQQHPEVVADYAAVVASGHPRALGLDDLSESVHAVSQAAGLVTQMVAPLAGDSTRTGLLVIGSTDPQRRYGDAELSAVEVLAALVGARRAVSQQVAQTAALRQRVEAVALAGRELAHLLNNDLTMPVGVVELLLDRSAATPDLQEMLQAASKDLAALEQHVRDFHDLMREHVDR
jgi:hypothetical protein